MQPSEQIKEKLDIVDVLREYIQLTAAGINFRARCPFHREKTPSFMVSPDKQIWHCFGCGEGGDIFSFVMKMEGIDFKEALRLLAPKAGVTLRRENPKITSQRNRTLDMNDLARKYYHKVLIESSEAEDARQYLKKRGLNKDTIEEWQIGYSQDGWENMVGFLKKQGYKENEIFLAGLIIKNEKRGSFYDRFRGRIMFPICDINSNAVGFTARVSPEKEASEKMGKYINSPQTMIYDKSKIIFGLDKAKFNIKREDLAVIVEGQMDVITAHQNGFKNVVASSGTALTGEQVILLKRYTPNIALAFDMDEAGSNAAERGIKEAMQAEMNIKVVEIPEGKDPDDCIKNNPDNWKKAVEEAKPMMQYYFDKVLAPLDLSDIVSKREAVKILLPIIIKLGNKIEQDFWLRDLSEKIDVDENLLRETLISNINKQKKPVRTVDNQPPEKPQQKILTREEKLSELLLALLFKFLELREYALNHIEIIHVYGEDNKSIYKNLIFYYNNIINSSSEYSNKDNNQAINYKEFKEWLDQKEINQNYRIDQSSILDRLVILGDKEYYQHTFDEAKNEAIRISVLLKESYLKTRMREIEKQIREYEKEKKDDLIGSLMDEFKILSDELRDLKNN